MIEEKIQNLIEQPLANLGYELVRIKHIGDDIIQIMIDSENGVNITDCTKVTKLINPILSVAEISDKYNLEVSSPGLDRPLIKPTHFIKFIGNTIKLNCFNLIDGQKKFMGELTNFNEETNIIELTCADKVVQINLDKVQSANIYYQPQNNKIKTKKGSDHA